MRLSKVSLALLATLVFHAPEMLAQSAMPTVDILTRVLMVRSKFGQGTIFSVDVDKREYWITAKHILTGAEHPPYGSIKVGSASLQILNPNAEGQRWLSVTFRVIDPGNNVDIVVLAPPKPILSNPLPSEPLDSTGATLGGSCEFLGFPFGGSWRATFSHGESYWMPFAKHCFISALVSGNPRVWVLDGINNGGFSGGPVVFRTGPEQKIIAVVSGYVQEPADVVSSFRQESASSVRQAKSQVRQRKQVAEVNSGFIIAYDISYATEAIKRMPIGPVRSPTRP